MKAGSVHSETTALSDDWQSWFVLRHFLSARLQRVLAHEIVRAATGGAISFDDLFEEVRVDRPLWNESWVVRPRPDARGYASSLQLWIRSMVWQNDETCGFTERNEDPERHFISGAFLDALAHFSSADIPTAGPRLAGVLQFAQSDAQRGVTCLIETLHRIRQRWDTGDYVARWEDIQSGLTTLPMPLQALALKHFADLYADADHWQSSLAGYIKVVSLLDAWAPSGGFLDEAQTWRTVALQSRAAALSIVESRKNAFELLEPLADRPLSENTVASANIGVDYVSGRSLLDSRGSRDIRIARMTAPLLHGTHGVGPAVASWQRGRFSTAHRQFWALLRRQTALGAATEARETKAAYARALLDEVTEEVEKNSAERNFEMAVNLLLESGRQDHVERIRWPRSMVDAYIVDESAVERFIKHAEAHCGTKSARARILIELFRTWTIQVTPSRPDPAIRMWRHIAILARTFEATMDSATDVGRPALRALAELAQRRPELRSHVETEVSSAIREKLKDNFPWSPVEAAKTALRYADAFNERTVRRLCEAILSVLEQEYDTNTFPPLVEPALSFLVSREVRARLAGDEEIGRRTLDQILRFGLAEDSDGRAVFFNLANFDEALLAQPLIRQRLSAALQKVQKGARQINASSVTDCIRALLVAPVVSGKDGLRDAIEGSLEILRSAERDHQSLGLTSIDDVLLLLVDRLEEVRAVFQDETEWLNEQLKLLTRELLHLWELAVDRPLIFAPFALPPRTRPSSVTVHNCAFATLRFGEAVGATSELRTVLTKASANAALRDGIALAHATSASDAKHAAVEYPEELEESRESFYKSMGRRLAQLQHLKGTKARDMCQRLLANCFHLGPHPADAALLVAAINLDLGEKAQELGLDTYGKRVEEDAETRLLLLPLVDLLTARATSESS